MTRLLLSGWRRLLLAVVLAATTSACGTALLGCAAWLLSRAAEHPAPSVLALVAVLVRALGLGRGVSRYAERLVGHDAALRVVAGLRVAVFAALVRSPVAVSSGDVLSTVVTDVEAVQDLWLRCLIPFAAAVLVSGVSVGAVLWWSTSAGLVLLAGLGLSVVLLPALSALGSLREAGVAAARARHQELVLDVLHGCADLTVLGALPVALAQAAAGAEALAAVDRRAARRAGGLALVAGSLQAATVVAVLAVSLPAVRDGSLPRVALAVLVLVGLASFEPVTPLVEAGALLPRTCGALRRTARLLAVPVTIPLAAAPTTPGVVELRGVGASYGRGEVLRNVDLRLQVGECVVVTGASGAGKSTLLGLLAGALAPSSGQALLGGVPTCELDELARSEQLVVAEQQAHLFAGSVRDNLRIGRPDATDAELLEALEVVALDPWFHGLPLGWETKVGERGSRVSGGERTRLGVARALLAQAPVLLLDEPTEGLDQQAADALLRRIIAGNRHRAVLIATHRLGGAEAADRVLVLKDGRLRSAGHDRRGVRVAAMGRR